ncbi:hypothetical protein N9B60_06230 [Mariniblastus sp.]|nr:hypothetical protein [Mariniblastus sp.]
MLSTSLQDIERVRFKKLLRDCVGEKLFRAFGKLTDRGIRVTSLPSPLPFRMKELGKLFLPVHGVAAGNFANWLIFEVGDQSNFRSTMIRDRTRFRRLLALNETLDELFDIQVFVRHDSPRGDETGVGKLEVKLVGGVFQPFQRMSRWVGIRICRFLKVSNMNPDFVCTGLGD